QLRFGHIPGNAPTVEGLQRKLEPLSFLSLPGRVEPFANSTTAPTKPQLMGFACALRTDGKDRHCEEQLRRSNPVLRSGKVDCCASLAMTMEERLGTSIDPTGTC